MLLLLFFVINYVINYDSIERAGWHDNYCYSSSFINFYRAYGHCAYSLKLDE